MDSPCLKICTYQPDAGMCVGCGRTLDEISSWRSMSDAERQQIMDELPARLEKLKRD